MSKFFRWMQPFSAADGAGGGGAAGDGGAAGAAAGDGGEGGGVLGAAKKEEGGKAEPGFDELLKGNPEYQKAVEERIAAAVAAQKQAAAKETEEQAAAEKAKAELEKLPEAEKPAALLAAEKARADKLQAEKDEILLKQDAAKMLAEKKLPASMVGMVVGADKEATTANLAAFETAFNEAVAAAVKEKLPGYTPKAQDGGGGAATMKDAIRDSMFGK